MYLKTIKPSYAGLDTILQGVRQMTMLDVIEIYDKIRPNSFDFAAKMAWVNSIETDIRRYAALHGENKEDMAFLKEENL